MPTYQYRCGHCQYEFEEFQSIKEDPLITCPSCAQPRLKRLFSGSTGLIFKGSGFYLTDYKNSHSSSKKESSGTKSSESTTSTSHAEATTPTSSSVEKSQV